MRYEKPEDGVRVTTPIVAGLGLPTLLGVSACDHEFEPLTDYEEVDAEKYPDVKICQEMCTKCKAATRARIVGPEATLVQAFAEGDSV